MRSSFLKDGQIPITKPPSVRIENGKLHLSHPQRASIGYRPSADAPWQLYVTPIPIPDAEVLTNMQVKAVRYGWRESKTVSANSAERSIKPVP